MLVSLLSFLMQAAGVLECSTGEPMFAVAARSRADKGSGNFGVKWLIGLNTPNLIRFLFNKSKQSSLPFGLQTVECVGGEARVYEREIITH